MFEQGNNRMNQGFSERIFTAKLFLGELKFIIWNLPKIIKVYIDKNRPKMLFEKILLVTDAVNGCIYCSWLDAKLAMSGGMSDDEIRSLMRLEFQTNAGESELTAILFAQHFAETNGHPDPEMLKKLFDYYGEKTAEDMILMIRTVTFGNLYFNTWRAVISRFKGNPAPASNIFFELIYFVFNFIIIMPFVILRKLDKKAIGVI